MLIDKPITLAIRDEQLCVAWTDRVSYGDDIKFTRPFEIEEIPRDFRVWGDLRQVYPLIEKRRRAA